MKSILSNKLQMHHFRELTPEARLLLGEIPDQFTCYWTSRFPFLLVHSWFSMQDCAATETTFKRYYHDFYYPYSLLNDQIAQLCLGNFYGFQNLSSSATLVNRKRENVGLYRNLPVDVDDIEFTLVDRRVKYQSKREMIGKDNRSKVVTRKKSKKRASNKDEPIKWNMTE